MGFYLPFFLREVYQSLRRNVLLNIASVSTVLVLTFILGFFALLIDNIDFMMDEAKKKLVIRVVLSDQLSLKKAGQLKHRIMKHPGVESARYIGKEQGFQQLRKKLGETIEMESVTRNPIPNVIDVEPKDPEHIPQICKDVEKYPGVTKVIPGKKEVVEAVIKLSHFIYNAGVVIIALLLISAIFLIANTIRLTVFSRRKEIAIMELVGASHWFIRGPFIMEGLIHGIAGSGLAVLLLNLLYRWGFQGVQKYLRVLPVLPPSHALLGISLWLLFIGICVGSLASFISVNKYLKV